VVDYTPAPPHTHPTSYTPHTHHTTTYYPALHTPHTTPALPHPPHLLHCTHLHTAHPTSFTTSPTHTLPTTHTTHTTYYYLPATTSASHTHTTHTPPYTPSSPPHTSHHTHTHTQLRWKKFYIALPSSSVHAYGFSMRYRCFSLRILLYAALYHAGAEREKNGTPRIWQPVMRLFMRHRTYQRCGAYHPYGRRGEIIVV